MPTLRPACSEISVVTATSRSAPSPDDAKVTGDAPASRSSSRQPRPARRTWRRRRSPDSVADFGGRLARQACRRLTSSISGGPRSAREPSVGHEIAFPVGSAHRRRATPCAAAFAHPDARHRSQHRRAPEARSRRQRRSCQLRTGTPSTATTRSPSRMPAAAAGLPRRTAQAAPAAPGMPAT